MPYLDLPGDRFHYHLDDYTDPWTEPTTVLLHHAAGGNLRRWRAWVPNLARQHRVLRFDMRGHGDTPPPAGGAFTLPGLAADIVAVLDGLEIDKAHLVGASAGGIVSLRCALDFPERLHSLTLVASTPKLAQMGSGIDAGVWRRTLEEQGTKAWLLADSQKRFGPQVHPGVVEWYAEEGARTAPEVVLALQGCLLAEDLTDLLPNIRVPTLILGSSRDDITPPEIQQEMGQGIPDATVQLFDGVGHNMKVEIPDLLSQRVLEFTRRLEG